MTIHSAGDKKKILIASAGTGGHLFPARYIAEALLKKDAAFDIRFIGAGRPLEAEIIDKSGFRRYVLKTSGISRLGFAGVIKWISSLPGAFLECKKIFKEFKPDIVIGVGGYITFIPIILGWLTGRPTWIHEAEHTPGMANNVLSLVAKRISLSHQNTVFLLSSKTVYTGHPLRTTMRTENFIKQGNERKNIFVTGGSQGAKAIDDVMLKISKNLAELKVAIFHQARQENCENLSKKYNELGMQSIVKSFVDNIEDIYRWSDLIITRTGAGAVREILVTQRPTICIPLPHAKEQYENAELIHNRGQGIIIEEGENFENRLMDAIILALKPDSFVIKKEDNTVSFDEAAAERIAEGVLELICA